MKIVTFRSNGQLLAALDSYDPFIFASGTGWVAAPCWHPSAKDLPDHISILYIPTTLA